MTTHFIGDAAPSCPTCGKKLDGATDFVGNATPSPGDFSVCSGCQDILVFTDELGLRELTEEDMKGLPLDMLTRYQKALGTVKQ